MNDNWLAHGNLGAYPTKYRNGGLKPSGISTALRIRPLYPEAHNNLGASLAGAGLCELAIPHFQMALGVTPNDVVVNTNLGLCLIATGRYLEAANQLRKRLTITRRSSDRPRQLRDGTHVSGREAELLSSSRRLKLSPEMPRAHRELAMLLLKLGRRSEAITSHLDASERIHPSPELSRPLADLRDARLIDVASADWTRNVPVAHSAQPLRR